MRAKVRGHWLLPTLLSQLSFSVKPHSFTFNSYIAMMQKQKKPFFFFFQMSPLHSWLKWMPVLTELYFKEHRHSLTSMQAHASSHTRTRSEPNGLPFPEVSASAARLDLCCVQCSGSWLPLSLHFHVLCTSAGQPDTSVDFHTLNWKHVRKKTKTNQNSHLPVLWKNLCNHRTESEKQQLFMTVT